jgi:hypothetical protein
MLVKGCAKCGVSDVGPFSCWGDLCSECLRRLRADDAVLYAEALVGWRIWSLSADDRLVSLHDHSEWTPRQPKVAAHRGELSSCSESPCLLGGPSIDGSARHGCGLYAMRTVEAAANDIVAWQAGLHMGDWCAGAVWLWGRIYEHERGLRAQYAYPKCILTISVRSDPSCRGRDLRAYTLTRLEQLNAAYGLRPTPEEESQWISAYRCAKSSLNPYISQGLLLPPPSVPKFVSRPSPAPPSPPPLIQPPQIQPRSRRNPFQSVCEWWLSTRKA